MSTIYSRVGGVGSAPSSRLTAGYLHTCSVKERRAGGGSEVECMELKLHFTAVGPSRLLILFKEVLSFNLSWTDEAGSSTWREEVEFTAVECETYYLISPRPLGSPAEGETLWSLSQLEQTMKGKSPSRWTSPGDDEAHGFGNDVDQLSYLHEEKLRNCVLVLCHQTVWSI